MPHLGPNELILVLVIALLIFGVDRLAGLGSAPGKGASDVRVAMGQETPRDVTMGPGANCDPTEVDQGATDDKNA